MSGQEDGALNAAWPKRAGTRHGPNPSSPIQNSLRVTLHILLERLPLVFLH